MARDHVHELRVRYAECDAQGVVFNAQYLMYADVAVTEHWRAAVGDYRQWVAGGHDLVVAEATVRFRSPARFDDVLHLQSEVAHIGTTSMRTEIRLVRAEAPDELLAEVDLRQVCVGAGTTAKRPVPEDVRAAFGHPPAAG